METCSERAFGCSRHCWPARKPRPACTNTATPRCRSGSASPSSLLNSIGMDADGARQAAAVCHWLLTSRLEFFEDRERYPVARGGDRPADVRDRRATFRHHADARADVGRSGCAGAAVLGGDVSVAAARALRRRRSAPAPADADWREINAKLPKWLHSHPYNDMLGDGLPEDERTWAFDFRVMTPTAWWRVPMQTVVGGLPTDPSRSTASTRRCCSSSNTTDRGNTGCSKASMGSGSRSSSRPIPMQSRVAAPRSGAGRGISHDDDGRHFGGHRRPDRPASRSQDASGSDPREHRQHHDASAASTTHASCTSATPTSSPIKCGVVRRYYDFCGRNLTAEAEAAMRDYLANNRGDRHGKFRYSTKLLTDIGEELDALHEEFRPFRERFGVEIEKRD